jgi:hypothetical protein
VEEEISTLFEQSVIGIIESNYKVSESRDQISPQNLSFYANLETKCHQSSQTLKWRCIYNKSLGSPAQTSS